MYNPFRPFRTVFRPLRCLRPSDDVLLLIFVTVLIALTLAWVVLYVAFILLPVSGHTLAVVSATLFGWWSLLHISSPRFD